MKKIFEVIKSSDSNLIMSVKDGKKFSILKIAQRGNSSLQREKETILKLKKVSKIYDYIMPEIYINKKIESSYLKNRFYYFQERYSGSTLSSLIQNNKIRCKNAKHYQKKLLIN